jgi:hypothetical protein
MKDKKAVLMVLCVFVVSLAFARLQPPSQHSQFSFLLGEHQGA